MKKKVCVIGTCGHVGQALRVLQARDDIDLCGVAPGSPYETVGEDFAEILPLFGNWRQMLDEVRPALAVVSPVFGLTGEVIAACAERKISVFSEKPVAVTLPVLCDSINPRRVLASRRSAQTERYCSKFVRCSSVNDSFNLDSRSLCFYISFFTRLPGRTARWQGERFP